MLKHSLFGERRSERHNSHGWKEDVYETLFILVIGLALMTAIIANPGIAFACNKLIGT
ncbi:UNVERIFIED_ORG: hypothetical protein GGI66_002967 [Rhizobium esperanzae]